MSRIWVLLVFAILCLRLHADAQRIAKEGYDVRFEKGFEADARQIAEAIEFSITRLNEVFPDWNAAKLIRSAHLEVYVQAKQDDRASEAKTSIHNGWKEGQYFAQLYVLAPSLIPATALTTAGQPKDRRHFEWLMIHELSSIVIDRVTHDKPDGWRIYSGPNWFVQGLENYLASSLSGSSETLKYYIARTRSDPSEVDTNFGICIKNDYVGGAAIVAFIARDSWLPLRRILLSSEPTFGLAMKKEFGGGVDDFGTQFRNWLELTQEAPNRSVNRTNAAPRPFEHE